MIDTNSGTACHTISVQYCVIDKHPRLDIGIPYYNGKKHMGCYPYWAGLDLWGMRNGEALNVLSFSGEEGQRLLHVPAIALQMSRR